MQAYIFREFCSYSEYRAETQNCYIFTSTNYMAEHTNELACENVYSPSLGQHITESKCAQQGPPFLLSQTESLRFSLQFAEPEHSLQGTTLPALRHLGYRTSACEPKTNKVGPVPYQKYTGLNGTQKQSHIHQHFKYQEYQAIYLEDLIVQQLLTQTEKILKLYTKTVLIFERCDY